MAKLRMVTFECKECGSEVVVTATGEVQLTPIYCCGVEVVETTTGGAAGRAKPKKPIAKKATKKIAQKKVIQKKKPSAKKK